MTKQLRGEISADDIERGKSFGNWLRVARARRGLNKKVLSEVSRVSDSYISVLENDGINKSTGQYQRPSEQIIHKLAIALSADEDQGRIAAGYSAKEDFVIPKGAVSSEDFMSALLGFASELRARGIDLSKVDKEPTPEVEYIVDLSEVSIEGSGDYSGVSRDIDKMARIAAKRAATSAAKNVYGETYRSVAEAMRAARNSEGAIGQRADDDEE